MNFHNRLPLYYYSVIGTRLTFRKQCISRVNKINKILVPLRANIVPNIIYHMI